MTHKIVINEKDIKEKTASWFGVDTDKVFVDWERKHVEVDLGAFYVNSEIVVKGD